VGITGKEQPYRDLKRRIMRLGREAGASLEHPHAQLLGMPFVPGHIAEEEAGFRRFEGSCVLCTTMEAESTAGHRIVHADEHVLVLCPFWSGGPYEMLVVPRTQLTAAATESSSVAALDIRTAYPLTVWEFTIGDTPAWRRPEG
jgi:UDPglucose--hexose-1-phosphate uridylyltransferase